VSRRTLGIPDNWETVTSWAATPFTFGAPIQEEYISTETRFAGINFSKKQPAEFWDKFKKNQLPSKPSTRINTSRLEKEINKVKGTWTIHQKRDAEKALGNLKNGAEAYQKSNLKGAILRNAASAYKFAPEVTANLEKWLHEKYLAGPFMEPPMKDFRANSIMAIEQNDKVRLVLNMSYPKGDSFNDNADKEAIAKVTKTIRPGPHEGWKRGSDVKAGPQRRLQANTGKARGPTAARNPLGRGLLRGNTADLRQHPLSGQF